jgi:type II secretion system protein I
MQKSPRRRHRQGFTLVELLVALVLIDCALLALVGGAALVLRQSNTASSRASAQLIAENRLARLSGGPCPAPQTGSADVAPGLHEEWQVQSLDSATRLLDDSVEIQFSGRQSGIALHFARRCQ